MRALTPLLGLALLGCQDAAEHHFQATTATGAALQAWEDPSTGARQERFELGEGASTPMADFLFVLDNSVSMGAVSGRIAAAFEALGKEGVFPANSRIAVLSTYPADLDHADRPHPIGRPARLLARDPGFAGLVDGPRIERFRKVAGEQVAARFQLDGCSSAWFAPDAKNAQGQPCIVAHTQIALHGANAEAGMLALSQWLEIPEADGFRPGAAVNVIFVSDTQDPGIVPTGKNPEIDAMALALLDARPTADQLKSAIRARYSSAAVRLHAYAPYSECVEQWAPLGPAYLDAARATGGITRDLCTTSDLSGMIREIAKQGAKLTYPVVPLGKPASAVEDVTVGGVTVPWTTDTLGRVVILDALPDAPSPVVVTYTTRVQPAAAAAAPTRGHGKRRAASDAAQAAPTPVAEPALPSGLR